MPNAIFSNPWVDPRLRETYNPARLTISLDWYNPLGFQQ